MRIFLTIGGMHCSGCAASVGNVLSEIEHVSAVSVDLAAGRAVVETDGAADRSTLVAAVEDAGYEARVEPEAAGA